MPLFLLGSLGPEVSRVQQRLAALGLYRGPIDGNFGGGTESAVIEFQRSHRLTPDGKVGPKTWARLFAGETIGHPALAGQPLGFRVLALTGAFETNAPPPDCFAGLSGDFDGQGISFGVCQWCLGQGSLQPLLLEADQRFPALMNRIFHGSLPQLRAVLQETISDQLEWARSIQDARHRLAEPWGGMFKTLGRSPEYQKVQLKHAGKLFAEAKKLCLAYALVSERALSLMFDIKVQNGTIKPVVDARIRQDMSAMGKGRGWKEREVGVMRIVANRRAEAAKSQWVEDVRARKLAIADGAGVVHGRRYDLEAQYGIGLRRVPA